VVWVGVQGEVERAALLAKKIEDACAALGFPREARAFSLHLTLGRVKRDAGPNDRRFVGEMIEKAAIGNLGVIQVASVHVIKSELRPGGSVYTRLHEVGLLGGSLIP
jgi:2'-5' RNA ligase